MNFIHGDRDIAPARETTRHLAGREWYYDFRELQKIGDPACKKVADRLMKRYVLQAKSWTPQQNSEWTCRLYFAAKLIMSASLNIAACVYADSKNLRIVVPYLRYYATLSLMRAITYTLPEQEWDGGQLIIISHAKALNAGVQQVAQFDSLVAEEIRKAVSLLKAEREFISYRAPSQGDGAIASNDAFLRHCTLLAEIAQFNSEILEVAIDRHADKSTFILNDSTASKIIFAEIEGKVFTDDEDWIRLGQWSRSAQPTNLRFYMREGHVDTFFGSWMPVDGDEPNDRFDPDDNTQIIFDIP